VIAPTGTPSTTCRPGRLKQLANTLADLFFPPRCVGCRSFGAWLCGRCLGEIEFIRPPICARCGLPWQPAQSPNLQDSEEPVGVCSRCRGALANLDGLRASAFHSGVLRQAIHQFKYQDLRILASPLGLLMAAGWPTLAPPGLEVDAIVPVPLHKTRERERGYNQAALLSRELGYRLNLPVVEDALVRTRATAPQVGLDAAGRRANVEGAFQCTKASLVGRRVLLVDDVFTTGATLEAAGAGLRQGGSQLVWAYALARPQ
jgi:ComF family protein